MFWSKIGFFGNLRPWGPLKIECVLKSSWLQGQKVKIEPGFKGVGSKAKKSSPVQFGNCHFCPKFRF